MTAVRLGRIGIAHPEHWIAQAEAARWIGEATGDHRRVAALARSSRINRRAICLPPAELMQLKTIGDRNQVYRDIAPRLAISASSEVLSGEAGALNLGLVTAVSCTGYMAPGWDGEIIREFDLSPHAVRLPITQAGCAGGVLALARAADHLRAHPDEDALVVSAELCSLAFHADLEPGNLTSVLIFGDGAGAALLRTSEEEHGEGMELIDSLSTLVPDSRDDLGFELTNEGFRSILSREVAEVLAEPTIAAVRQLLLRHELLPADIGFWLVHAGGPRIIAGVEECFELPSGTLRWSWQTLAEVGNTSSASIFEVIQRYLDDNAAPGGWGVVIAFGPGVAIEVLLVRRCS
jgi:alkylresorcinol/alkylpyrone synthase